MVWPTVTDMTDFGGAAQEKTPMKLKYALSTFALPLCLHDLRDRLRVNGLEACSEEGGL
jgi:hypothetical protein